MSHPQSDGHLMIIDEKPIRGIRDQNPRTAGCRVERGLGSGDVGG
jgi:hypothetical protein